MTTTMPLLLIAIVLALPAAHAQSVTPEAGKDSGWESADSAGAVKMESVERELEGLSASQAVRRGNELLRVGRPAEALLAYEYARQLEPQAREIAFLRGLAYFDLGEFDTAREMFRKVVALADDSLTDNAQYGLGVTDHREALETLEVNPRLALSLLESAMQRYHDVLAKQPDHTRARAANFKAASIWRELRQRSEQRQQRQDKGQGANERPSLQHPPEVDEQDQLQKIQPQPRPSWEQPESGAERRSVDQQRQQGAQAAEQRQVSREQAERRLREMIQAVRDRKSARRQRVQPAPIAPVDKDW